MGLIRFVFEPAELAQRWPYLRAAYLTGLDGVPWRTWLEVRPGQLHALRDVSESGALHVLWPIPGHLALGMATTTLAERKEPYDLNVELARGAVSRVLRFAQELEAARLGLALPYRGQLRQLLQTLVRLVLEAEGLSRFELGQSCLKQAAELGEQLVRDYTRHVGQQRSVARRMPLTVVRLRPQDLQEVSPQELRAYFGAVQLLILWRELEPTQGVFVWDPFDAALRRCSEAGLPLAAGPLICWEKSALPDWLWLWADDSALITEFAIRFVQEVVRRYAGEVRVWEVSARMNCGEALPWSLDERLRLAGMTLDAARQVHRDGFLYLTVGQPWSEYAGRRDDCGSLYFVDTLARCDLGLKGIGLELTYGYGTATSWPRDPLATLFLLDQYASFGLPLVVSLAAPAGSGSSQSPLVPAEPLATTECRDTDMVSLQQRFVASTLALLVSRPQVASVVWSHLSDRTTPYFPEAGLLDQQGRPRPLLQLFEEYREGQVP
jgi:hypothetical protein